MKRTGIFTANACNFNIQRSQLPYLWNNHLQIVLAATDSPLSPISVHCFVNSWL